METRLKEVFAFVNNKGGVAKTTSVQNVAAGMLRKNPSLRILVIDLDPQCNLSSLMNWSSYQDDITVYDSLIAADADPLPDLHVYQSEPGLYFLPASPKLADIERALNTQMQPKLALSTILGSPLHLHSNTQGATTQEATTQGATVLGDFVAEQSTTTTQTAATDEETTTETITETTSPDGTQSRTTTRRTTRRTTNTNTYTPSHTYTTYTTLSAYQYADSIVSASQSRNHTTTSDTLTSSQSTQKTPTSTSPFPSSLKIIIIILISVLISEIAERIYNKNKNKES